MDPLRLSPADLDFFVREGYLIKRDALDPALCRSALDELWRTNESSVVSRGEPESWVGAFGDDDRSSDHENVRGNPPDVWYCKRSRASTLMLDLVPRRLMAAAEQLLGEGTLVSPDEGRPPDDAPKKTGAADMPGNERGIGQHLRGVISIMPQPPDAPRAPQTGLHVDGHPFSLGVCAYLDVVPPGAGAFACWPRSHRRLFHLQPWHYSSRNAAAEEPPNPRAEAELEAILRDTHPVECTGDAGTVIMFHHRLGHAKGINRSATGGAAPRIRHACFVDFLKKPHLFLADGNSAVEASENGDGPPPRDMWAAWSDAVRAAAARQPRGRL